MPTTDNMNSSADAAVGHAHVAERVPRAPSTVRASHAWTGVVLSLVCMVPSAPEAVAHRRVSCVHRHTASEWPRQALLQRSCELLCHTSWNKGQSKGLSREGPGGPEGWGRLPGLGDTNRVHLPVPM